MMECLGLVLCTRQVILRMDRLSAVTPGVVVKWCSIVLIERKKLYCVRCLSWVKNNTGGRQAHRGSGTGQTPVTVGSLTLCFYRKPPRAFPSVWQTISCIVIVFIFHSLLSRGVAFLWVWVLYMCVRLCVYLFTNVCVYVHICMRIICVRMYIYLNKIIIYIHVIYTWYPWYRVCMYERERDWWV